MNNSPLIQQALGDDWHKLPLVIQSHYLFQHDQKTSNIVTGTMCINYTNFVKPMLFITRLMGGLIDLKGDNMNTHVEKWVNSDKPNTLFWKRTIQAPDGKSTIFASRMEYQQDNELIEFVGGGFGLYLKLTVENSKLVYRSNGHLWQMGKLRLPIPDVLFLGHATITETALSEQRFELDFRIKHPLLGETYRYGGIFQVNQHNS
ncbi:MAG: DUF4166 domain-containing protein [Methyloglobulus sp.]|nr:DUF4166 domain-containing protein [Methyloglobulus sp.]